MSPAQREELLKKYYLALRVLGQESEVDPNLPAQTEVPSSARMRLTIQKAQEINQINYLL